MSTNVRPESMERISTRALADAFIAEQVEEKKSQNIELSKQAKELIKKIDDLEAKEKNNQE